MDRHGTVKLSDFGVSTVLAQGAQAHSQIGSTAYMSPERIRGDQHGPTADIWSVGVTCAECALGVFPFRPDDFDWTLDAPENPFTQFVNMFDLSALIADNRATVDWDFLLPNITKHYPNRSAPSPSEFCKDFVAQCMMQDPDARPLCAQLISNHPFLITSEQTGVELKEWLNRITQIKDCRSPDSCGSIKRLTILSPLRSPSTPHSPPTKH
jgi:serine/threonine protein kinase